MKRHRARSLTDGGEPNRRPSRQQYGSNLSTSRRCEENVGSIDVQQNNLQTYINSEDSSGMSVIRQMVLPSHPHHQQRPIMSIAGNGDDSISGNNAATMVVVGNYTASQITNSGVGVSGRRTTSSSCSQERGSGPRLPPNLDSLPKIDYFPVKKERWNTNEEILSLLLNFSQHEEWQTRDVIIRPLSGSMLMYSRKKVRYRRDGYCWKKRKDGKTTREDHMKLKVQGVECIYGCYVHSAVLPTFHRRCYWLLENPDIVIVHYLNVPYPEDDKLTGTLPNVSLCVESKEWTKEELLQQLQPMYEYTPLQDHQQLPVQDHRARRAAIVESHIESVIAQVLEKQEFVKSTSTTCLTDGLACSGDCNSATTSSHCVQVASCSQTIRKISASGGMSASGNNSSGNGRKATKRGAAPSFAAGGSAADYLAPPKIAYHHPASAATNSIHDNSGVVNAARNLASNTMTSVAVARMSATQSSLERQVVDLTNELQQSQQRQRQQNRQSVAATTSDVMETSAAANAAAAAPVTDRNRRSLKVLDRLNAAVYYNGAMHTTTTTMTTAIIQEEESQSAEMEPSSHELHQQIVDQLLLNNSQQVYEQQQSSQLVPHAAQFQENFEHLGFQQQMAVNTSLEERAQNLEQQRQLDVGNSILESAATSEIRNILVQQSILQMNKYFALNIDNGGNVLDTTTDDETTTSPSTSFTTTTTTTTTTNATAIVTPTDNTTDTTTTDNTTNTIIATTNSNEDCCQLSNAYIHSLKNRYLGDNLSSATTFEDFQNIDVGNFDGIVLDETTIWIDDIGQLGSPNAPYSAATPLEQSRTESGVDAATQQNIISNELVTASQPTNDPNGGIGGESDAGSSSAAGNSGGAGGSHGATGAGSASDTNGVGSTNGAKGAGGSGGFHGGGGGGGVNNRNAVVSSGSGSSAGAHGDPSISSPHGSRGANGSGGVYGVSYASGVGGTRGVEGCGIVYGIGYAGRAGIAGGSGGNSQIHFDMALDLTGKQSVQQQPPIQQQQLVQQQQPVQQQQQPIQQPQLIHQQQHVQLQHGYDSFEAIFALPNLQNNGGNAATDAEILDAANIIPDEIANNADDFNISAALYENALMNFDPTEFGSDIIEDDNNQAGNNSTSIVNAGNDDRKSLTIGFGSSDDNEWNEPVEIDEQLADEADHIIQQLLVDNQWLQQSDLSSGIDYPLMVLDVSSIDDVWSSYTE